MLTQTDRARVKKLLGMLGSDFAGERDNAASLLNAMAKRFKMTLPELCGAEARPAPPQQPPPQPKQPPPPKPQKAEFSVIGDLGFVLRECSQALSQWELNFCESIQARYQDDDDLSEKQMAKAKAIIVKVAGIMSRRTG